jgi:hypothetical protein
VSLTVELWNEANSSKVGDVTVAGTPDSVLNASIAGRKNALALGECQIRNDHPQINAFTTGRHLRWKDGSTLLHTTLLGKRHKTSVGRNRNKSKTTRIQSYSHVAAWKKAMVLPYGGTSFRPVPDVRSFGAHAPETPTTGWSSAVLQYAGIASPIAGVPGFEPWVPPDGWPGPIDDVDWVSFEAAPSDTSGVRPLRGTFTNPSQQDLWFCLASDDGARLFLDGIEIIPWTVRYPGEGSFRSLWRQVVPDVSAGTHTWSVELEVLPGTPSGPRRGMVAAAVHKLPAAGTTLGASTFISGTSAGWKCRTTAGDFPACNPHRVVAALLADAQAENMLAGWSLGSTSSVDSSGASWPATAEQAFRIGDDLLSVLDAMVANGAIDGYRARPSGKVLDLFAPGNMGEATAATFTAGTNLTDDEEEWELECTNLLLVRKDDGYVIKESAASQSALGATYGESLAMPKISDTATITQAASAVFSMDGAPSRSRAVQIAPSRPEDRPGTGFFEGDTVTVGAEELTVQMWEITQRGKAPLRYSIEVDTARQVNEERTKSWLSSLGQGTLGGRNSAAILPTDQADPLPSGKLARRDFPVYSPDDDPETYAPVVGTNKAVRNADGARRVTLFEVKGLWTPADDMPYISGDSGPRIARTPYVAAVQRNGLNVAVLILDPDDFEKLALIEDGLYLETDSYNCAGFGGVGFNGVTMQTTAVEAI